MRLLKLKVGLLARGLVASLMLGCLALVAGAHLVPQVAIRTVLLYSALGAAVLLALLVLLAVATLTFQQFILRHGATDTQWFWFSSEPRGLVQLRQQAARERAKPEQ
jgi:hypothetical protein